MTLNVPRREHITSIFANNPRTIHHGVQRAQTRGQRIRQVYKQLVKRQDRMRAKQETYCHVSAAFVILYPMLVGLMKGLVTHALLIALYSYCDLADHCPHEINLNVFRASFDALLRRS